MFAIGQVDAAAEGHRALLENTLCVDQGCLNKNAAVENPIPGHRLQIDFSFVLTVLSENLAQRLVGAVKSSFGVFLAESRQIDDVAFRSGEGA